MAGLGAKADLESAKAVAEQGNEQERLGQALEGKFAVLPLSFLDGKADKSMPLSECAFGTCYRSRDNFAVAQVVHAKLNGDVTMLKKMQHKNLLAALACSPIEGDRLDIMYKINNEDTCLDTHLVNDEAAVKLTWPIRLSIALGISQALKYLADASLYHKDLRCSNVVLQGFTPKLMWGGVAGLIDLGDVVFGGESHMCPEYRRSGKNVKNTEVFALGMVFGEIISGTVSSCDDLGLGIADMRLNDESEIVDPLTALSERCKEDRSASRPELAEIVESLQSLSKQSGGVLPEEPQTHSMVERAASPKKDDSLLDAIGQSMSGSSVVVAETGNEQEKLDQAREGKFAVLPLSFLDGKADKSMPLSECAFGTCYRSRDNFAVAQVVHAKLNGDVTMLKKIQHNNFLAALACSPIEGGRLNIMYKINNEDTCLDTHLVNDEAAVKLTWPIRLSIALGISQALKYLADASLYHKDLRCSNVVLQGFTPKLMWGGVAGLIDLGDVVFGGESHMCPEYRRSGKYVKNTEVFALGKVFGDIISGTVSGPNDVFKTSGFSGFANIPDMRLTEETEIVETLTSLAEKCTTPSAGSRLHLSDIVNLLAGVSGSGVPETVDPPSVAPTPPTTAPTPPAAPAPTAPAVSKVIASAAPATPAAPVPPPATTAESRKPTSTCILCFDIDSKKPGIICPRVLEDSSCFTCKACYEEQMGKNCLSCPKCKTPYQDSAKQGEEPAESPQGEFSREIEDEANNNFAKIYSGDREIAGLIEMLTEYKKMPRDKQEHKVYLCMIHNLFDEFKFLNRYPAKELKITAELFGGIVANKALEDDKLLHALKFVFTNLAVHSTNENLHKFSVWALGKYMHRLPEWPQYCALLRDKVKNIQSLVPGIEKHLVARSGEQPAAPAAPTSTPVPTPAPTPAPAPAPAAKKPAPKPAERGIGASHIFDISTLENQAAHPVPDVQVVDRIAFIANNLDNNNLAQSCKDILTILKPQFMPYFGDYIVIKRASLEPNFHKLYMQMLIKLSNKELDTAVQNSSIAAVKALLHSERILTESSEKSLLKNLGSWLGLQTIARNKPIMGRKLDLKGMLMNSVGEGMMAAVVPFVAKVMEQCNASTVFRPPNPWTMSVMYILGDIYQLPVKLTLKFEIEVLCQTLGITVADLEDPSGGEQRAKVKQLFESGPKSEDLGQLTRPKAPQQPKAPEVPVVQPAPEVAKPAPAPVSTPTPAPAQAATKPKDDAWSSGKDASVSWIPPSNKQYSQDRSPPSTFPEHIRGMASTNVEFKKAVCKALEDGLQELSTAVVGRSVFIAKTATKELVVKDFATEPDDEKMKLAAQQMVKCLAAHLAIVTCKETLKVTIRNNLKALLPNENIQLIETMAKENLDYGVSLVEELAISEASKEMEQCLAPVIEKRQKEGTTQADKDIPFVATLPNDNRPKNGLMPVHTQVYADFGKLTEPKEQTPEQAKALERLNQLLRDIEQETERHYNGTTSPDQNVLSLTHTTFTTHTQSPSHDAIKKLLCNIPPLIKEDTAVTFAKHIFAKVFDLGDRIQNEQNKDNEKGLHVAMLINEVCLFILQSVREKNIQKIVDELTKLFIAHEKKWKNKDIAVNFIRLRLIDVTHFDTHLTKALQVRDPQRTVVEFAGSIVQKCLVDEKLTSQKELKQTLDALQTIASKGQKRANQQQAQAQVQQLPPPQQPQVPQQPQPHQVPALKK